MAVVGIADQYMIILAVTLVFTVLALAETEGGSTKIILQWIAGVMWVVSGFAHFLVGDTTSYLTYPLTYVFVGLGLIFCVVGLYNSIQAMDVKGKISRRGNI